MYRIRDLVTLPEVRTVIQLASVKRETTHDSELESRLHELIDTFVLTEDIQQNLHIVLSSVASNHGEGFFLSGTYGSGKTHFLAALSIVLRHAWAQELVSKTWQGLGQLLAQLRNHSYLSITIPLINYRRDQSLEWIVFSEAEHALSQEGFASTLSDTAYFNETFTTYIEPVHRIEIESFITAKTARKLTWSQLCEFSPEDAHQLGVQFLHSMEQPIPFQMLPDREAAVQKLLQAALSLGFSGVVIMLDELSEFLRSKQGTGNLSEDARFLQFLGEKSAHLPLWIMGALQEAIEKTTLVQESVFNKIKDRYPKRLGLSSRHLRSLIDQRLIQKKTPESYIAIREAYRILHKSFGKLDLGEESFIQGYPVHPETLELLDLNKDLFSQRRGVVDFIHQRVKGNPGLGIRGILDESYTTLLTPDSIFDHFEDRIATIPRLAPYYRLYEDQFKREIPRIFKDTDDLQWAMKLSKILFLLAITPTAPRRTVRDLCHMCMNRLADTSIGMSDLNYEYMEEQILGRLFKEVRHIRLEKGAKRFEDVYSIDLEKDIQQIFALQVQERIESIGIDNPVIFETAYRAIQHGSIPFALLFNRIEKRSMIRWQNTIRAGSVWLGDLVEVDQRITGLLQEMDRAEADFHILLATLSNPHAQQEHFQNLLQGVVSRFAAGIIALIPRQLKNTEDARIIARFHVVLEMLRELDGKDAEHDVQLRKLASIEKDQLLPQVRDILISAYRNGAIYNSQGKIPVLLSMAPAESFDDFIQKVIDKPLQQLFPRHSEIMPGVQMTSMIIAEDILSRFILDAATPDRNEPRGIAIHNLVEQIVRPMNLVRLSGGKYLLDINPQKAPLVQTVLNLFPTGGSDPGLLRGTEVISLKSMMHSLYKSEFGLTPPMFEVLIVAMARLGYVILLKGNQQTPLASLRFPLSAVVDNVSKGALIDQRLRNMLQQIYSAFFHGSMKSFDLAIQEEVWQKLCRFKEEHLKQTEQYQTQMASFSKYSGFQPGELTQTNRTLQEMHILFQAIDTKANSYNGLVQFLDTITDKIAILDLATDYRRVAKFFGSILPKLPLIGRYMTSELLVIPDAVGYERLQSALVDVRALMQLDDRTILTENGQRLLEQFQSFQDLYAEFYAREHEARRQSVPKEELLRLLGSPELRALQLLSHVKKLGLATELQRMTTHIQKLVTGVCPQFVSELIRTVPVCTCQLKLGESQPKIAVDELRKAVINSIRTGLRILSEREIGANLIQRLERMKKETMLADKGLQLIQEIPRLDDARLIERLSEVVSEPLMQLIDSLLRTEHPIKRISIRQFMQPLAGQQLTFRQLQEAFIRWLESQGIASENDVVEIDET